MVIDIHSHIVPTILFERFAEAAGSFPSVQMERLVDGKGKEAFRFHFPGSIPTRPVIAELSDLAARKAAMDAEGIDHALLSLWTDLEGYELPNDEGAAWSRFINACVNDAVREEPRFTPLASVPLQDGALAATVLQEAAELNFGGVMIGTLPKGIGGGNLDDSALEPFWKAAADLKMAVYIHPMFLCNEPRLLDYELINTVGRLADTTIAVGRVIYSGLLQKYPDLKVVLSHGGAALPYALGRFQRTYEAGGRKFADPKDSFSRLYFDSCVYDVDTLHFLIMKAGADRVLMGSDAPMSIAETHPLQFIDRAGLRADQRQAIVETNARHVFRLRSQCNCN
jgi:aminocarboxymuconate-semialdehyde decarboxylase